MSMSLQDRVRYSMFRKRGPFLNKRYWTLVKKMNHTFQNKPCSIYNNYKNQATGCFLKEKYSPFVISTLLWSPYRYVSFLKNRVTHENEKYFKQHDHILVCTIMQTPLF